ncbi:hypothetical protein V8C35DRAFT_316667 [Trichoderma chlorosporum]
MALLSLKTRRPLSGTTECHNISFLHPGYPDRRNILLMLPAFDSGGIHHETARVACAILANSRWDGYLTTTRDGDAIPEGKDDILLGKQYYFRIPESPSSDHQYPIVPSFDNFLCPTTLPDLWTTSFIESTTNNDIRNRDQTCRITGSLLPNETAHIIPQAQAEWWQRNSMFTYTTNPDTSSDTFCADNAILLRRDVHKMWDDDHFTIVPKKAKWVIHLLRNTSSNELETQYHNLELQSLSGVARHFFFCRFALTIFSKSLFLSQNVSRELVTLNSDGTTQQRSFPANEYRELFLPVARANSRSQSPSPKKRPRSVEDCTDETVSGSEDENERGRRRKRSFSSHRAFG